MQKCSSKIILEKSNISSNSSWNESVISLNYYSFTSQKVQSLM